MIATIDHAIANLPSDATILKKGKGSMII